MMKLTIGLLAGLFLLAGCASLGGDNDPIISARLADKVVEVDDQYRPLRVCLLAAGIIEIMTDRIQVFDSSQAPEALGRLIALQGAVDKARFADPLWINTDMTDVALMFAGVLAKAGQNKLSRILLGGPTISNFLDVAARATLQAAKGDALLFDINIMLNGVEAGTYTKDQIWNACEKKIAENRLILNTLSGVSLQ